MMVRECREEDVMLLEEHMPFAGAAPLSHTPRFERHRDGASTLLVAWRGGVPVGSCEVLWDGCEAPEVRAVEGGCPEIHGLGQWPETLRTQPVGTALIDAAEELARARGLDRIGLGVEKNNPRTESLFKRLGYTASTPYLDCWTYQDGAGLVHRVADACTFMVKQLPAPGPA